jgi:LysM repeat protein
MGIVMNNHMGFNVLPRAWLWITAGIWLSAALQVPAQDKTYTVRKHETLTGIARQHGVSVAELAKVNQLKTPDAIREGQQLRIPSKGTASALGTTLLKRLDQTRVETGKWKYIVIHHSATDVGNVKSMDRYHREQRHMENGLAYHFIIGNGRGMEDGEVGLGPRWPEQINGGHLRSETQNAQSIGICLVGNFDAQRPTARQMRSLNALVDYLIERCRLGPAAVKTHQQINTVHTECPGRLFPAAEFARDLKARH